MKELNLEKGNPMSKMGEHYKICLVYAELCKAWNKLSTAKIFKFGICYIMSKLFI